VLCKDVLYPILDRLGIPKKKGASGFHTFRHSAASIVNEQTGNLKVAQKFLRHSTIEMTADIYTLTLTSVQAEREAAIALERAIPAICSQLFPNIEVLPIWFKRSHVGILTASVQYGDSMALRSLGPAKRNLRNSFTKRQMRS
jgi:hypothetical protein